MPPPPIEEEQPTRAVWAGDEMVVMSGEAIAAYRPATNDWRVLGTGFPSAIHPAMAVVLEALVYSATPSGIIELDPASGRWRELPRPGFVGAEPHRGALRELEGTLYAIGSGPGPCDGRRLASWTGVEWESRPGVSLAPNEVADCSYPNQTGAIDGRIVVWGDLSGPAMAYTPSADAWSPIGSTTLSGSEGPLGPITLDGRLLVPSYGEASIFDPATDEWTAVELPGGGTDTEMVWTRR